MLGLGLSAALQAGDPRIESWVTDRSGLYARIFTNAAAQAAGVTVTTWSNGTQTQSQPAYSGPQAIYSSDSWIYIRTTGLGIHVMGPWSVGFPNLPANQHTIYRIPRTAAVPNTETLTGDGQIGRFVDGVAMFDSRDAHYWNGSADTAGAGDWNRDAYVNEGPTFDPAFAHQEGSGTYHYHANPIALRYLLGDHVNFDPQTRTYSESTNAVTAHSPILGWVSDGYPIYGPYGYGVATNPASSVRRMISGFQLRDGNRNSDNLTVTGRKTLPAWAARLYGSSGTQTGPDVSASYPLGRYMEDNAYLGDLGYEKGVDFDLDENNGRYCVTPEYPNGTYAYFVSMAVDGTPVFPYNIGRAYHGSPTGGPVSSLTEAVVTNFVGGADTALAVTSLARTNSEVTLVWSAVEGGSYEIDESGDLKSWNTALAGVIASSNVVSSATTNAANIQFFQILRTGLATFDSVTNANASTGGGPGGGGGPSPTLASVAPTSGAHGSTVNLSMDLGAMAPPAGVEPSSTTLGSISGTNLSRSGSIVTATFAIPGDATTGAVTVSVVFPGPPGMGNVTFSLANGFLID